MSRQYEPIAPRHLSETDEALLAQRGKEFVNQFSILLKTARIHSRDNKTFRAQLDQTYRLIRECIEEFGELTMQSQSGYLFFDGVRVKQDTESATSSAYVLELFEKIKISGFVMVSGIAANEIEGATIQFLDLETRGPADFEELQQRFDDSLLESIELLPPLIDRQVDFDEEHAKRAFARKTFFYAVNNLKTATKLVSSGKSVNLARTHRVIHSLVDQILSDDSYLIELTALKSYDEYTFFHSVNVCIYAIRLGTGINLNKNELSTLGFSALFHDIGKVKLPQEILNKPTDFSQNEWELMRKHPTYGVLTIAKTMPFDERSCRAMLVAFEHHFNLDGTGYPVVKFKRQLNMFSKIVAICDVFDALTSGRIYRKNAIAPQNVIFNMARQSGHKFDPLLLKVFFGAVGVYPPGTLLLLDRNEYAVVIGGNKHDLGRPRVKLIANSEGCYAQGTRINLADKDVETGQYLRGIVKVLTPEECRIDTVKYILEDD